MVLHCVLDDVICMHALLITLPSRLGRNKVLGMSDGELSVYIVMI